MISQGLFVFEGITASPAGPQYNSPNKMVMGMTQYHFLDYWGRCFCKSPITHPQYKWVLHINEKFIFSFFPPFPCPTRSSLFPRRQFILFPLLLLLLSQLPGELRAAGNQTGMSQAMRRGPRPQAGPPDHSHGVAPSLPSALIGETRPAPIPFRCIFVHEFPVTSNF